MKCTGAWLCLLATLYFQPLLAQQQVSLTSVNGSGTTNFIPVWTSSTGLGNSELFQTSGQVGVGTTAPSAKVDVLTFKPIAFRATTLNTFGTAGLFRAPLNGKLLSAQTTSGQEVFSVLGAGAVNISGQLTVPTAFINFQPSVNAGPSIFDAAHLGVPGIFVKTEDPITPALVVQGGGPSLVVQSGGNAGSTLQLTNTAHLRSATLR